MAPKPISSLPAASAITGAELIEVSQLSTSITITATTISALASDNSYNDSATGFVTAGFLTGDRVKVVGFTGDTANNIFIGTVGSVTAGKMVIDAPEGDVIVDDAAGESVTITKWTSRRTTSNAVGGGGGVAQYASVHRAATSSTAHASKGSLLIPLVDITVSKLTGYIVSSGGTYKAGLYEVDGSNVVTSIMRESAAIVLPSTTTTHQLALTSEVTLTAGSRYCLTITRTDATATTSSGIYGGNGDLGEAAPVVQSNSFLYADTVAVAVSTAFTLGATPYAVGMFFSIA